MVDTFATRTFRSVQRHRNYRLYFFGQVASLGGTWMQTVALYWLILNLTHSPVAVGLLSLARYGPFSLFGLFTGVLADRFDNRKIVLLTQAAQLLVAAALAEITLTGQEHAWELYALAVLGGVAEVIEVPARQNFIVQLVGGAELPNAVALNVTVGNAARTAGPALAGFIIAAYGVGWCFAINSVSFIAVIAGLLAIRVTELHKLHGRRRPSLWKGMREGLTYVRQTRQAAVVVGITIVVMSFAFNVNVLLPVLAKQTLRAGPQTLGILTASYGAGAIVGAVVSAAAAKPRLKFMLAGTGAVGLLEALIAPLHTVYLVALLLFLCGICYTTYASSSTASVQLETPNHIRGRVLGVYFYAWNAPLAVFSPFLGWLCAVGGTELGFGFAGAAALAATIIAALALRRPRCTQRLIETSERPAPFVA